MGEVITVNGKTYELVDVLSADDNSRDAALPCPACGGSGHYDDAGSPPCGACDGTGLKQ